MKTLLNETQFFLFLGTFVSRILLGPPRHKPSKAARIERLSGNRTEKCFFSGLKQNESHYENESSALNLLSRSSRVSLNASEWAMMNQ
jgi:hypothetical protein